ncbi:MAG TPA: ParB N-terminal domain-containing protein [Acidothermaceae bacterium]|nr:ParB N-terminal domain-containing protein [Acidothermaceae bacterium]
MATTFPTTPAGTTAVALEKIHVSANVRELDPDHVDALAGSIALQGQLVPVLIGPAEGEVADQGFEFELVAGFHRYAAVAKLQHGAIDAVLRERDEDGDGAEVAAACATENIASCRRRHDAINADHVVMPIPTAEAWFAGRTEGLMSA